jgi:hypothetical protein
MKGGKGGRGRTSGPARTTDKGPPRGTTKKGAPKKDWGAVPVDDLTASTLPTKSGGVKPATPRTRE